MLEARWRASTLIAMQEITLVLGALVIMGFAGFARAIFAPFAVIVGGVGILVLGLVVGLPTGFWYHAVLYRLVSAKHPLPRRWWLSPANLHPQLTAAEERRIRPWYRIGGAGFVLCIVGGLAVIAGAFME